MACHQTSGRLLLRPSLHGEHSYVGVKAEHVPSDVAELLSNLLTSNDFKEFKQNHARSLDMRLRWSFGSVCRDGSVKAARIFVNAGLKVIDLCTDYSSTTAKNFTTLSSHL